MKKPFFYASAAALYIVVVVFVMQTLSTLLKSQDGTFVIPMTVLSVFVLSASIMGFFFLSEPVSLLVAGKKQEAITYFGKVVGFFACYVFLFAIMAFFASHSVLR